MIQISEAAQTHFRKLIEREAIAGLGVRLSAQHPGTAHFLAGKICRRFVDDNPPASLVQSIADSLHANWQAPDQIAQAIHLLLQSSAFKTSWGTKMKRPAMAAVTTPNRNKTVIMRR